LIVRDLLVSPKRFTDLHSGLPGIPTNVLTSRLKELEEAGIVRRRVLPRPERAVVYELSEYGSELEESVVALGRWGARSLGNPRPSEVLTAQSLVTALRSTFRSEAARDIRVGYELRCGPIVLHARIGDGAVQVAEGALPDADLFIETDPSLRELMAGEISPADAIKRGSVVIRGDKRLFKRFVEIFHIDPMPQSIAVPR
jgi:DNA-binding HxlR family transcriptional regulator